MPVLVVILDHGSLSYSVDLKPGFKKFGTGAYARNKALGEVAHGEMEISLRKFFEENDRLLRDHLSKKELRFDVTGDKRDLALWDDKKKIIFSSDNLSKFLKELTVRTQNEGPLDRGHVPPAPGKK